MRAVFSVDLPAHPDGNFPSDAEIIELLRSFGWEPVELRATESANAQSKVDSVAIATARIPKYKTLAGPLFE